ncbi:MAG: hypothetical protein R3A47_02690 [Polyangiales bacterium]
MAKQGSEEFELFVSEDEIEEIGEDESEPIDLDEDLQAIEERDSIRVIDK